MAIALLNKQPHKERFRIVGNERLMVLALVNEPPEDIKYSNNSVVRMIEISDKAIEVQGKQIQNTSRTKAIYLMGSFMLLREEKTYRAYEATHLNQRWSRQVSQVHPVSGLETGKLHYVELGKINLSVLWDAKASYDDVNPTMFLTIYSTDPLQAADIVGSFLIRQVKKDYGLYVARAEYQSASTP
ncbi:MAG: hypothetical protein [Caudoviricetes sp.]|nr:MAG: hypothetical protein [Caudoviricetes sp.]